MNVIRMIKLFGWEPKMSDRLAAKRQEELKFIVKMKMLQMFNQSIK